MMNGNNEISQADIDKYNEVINEKEQSVGNNENDSSAELIRLDDRNSESKLNDDNEEANNYDEKVFTDYLNEIMHDEQAEIESKYINNNNNNNDVFNKDESNNNGNDLCEADAKKLIENNVINKIGNNNDDNDENLFVPISENEDNNNNQKVTEFVPTKKSSSVKFNNDENVNNNNNSIYNKSNSDDTYKTGICHNTRIWQYDDFISIEKYRQISHSLSCYSPSDFQLTNEVLQLLLACLNFAKCKVSYFIVSILFEFSKNDEKVANEFKKSISRRLYFRVDLFLFYKCFELIENSEDHQVASILLPKLVKIIGHNIDLGVDFERQLFRTLPFDRTLIFSIISDYYQSNSKQIPFEKIIKIYDENHEFDDEFWLFMQSLLDTNGINATDDDGFNQLKECIDKYDFKKATRTFVYFLKSYYFIINLYENRMKTKDFYKQTVKGPVIFKRSKLPPIGLDQFFKLLELAENDEVASIAINIILLFTTSYESFEYDDPIEIINTIILPKIKSLNMNDSNLIKRYLKVLFEISRQTEISLDLSDFGFPKHSIYRDEIIILQIDGLDIHQNLICCKNDTFSSVQRRLIELYPFLNDIHLYFKHNRTYIHDENHPLYYYDFESNHPEIEVSNFQSDVIGKNVDRCKKLAPNCPSLFLTDQHFQDLLLSFINDQNLNEIVNKFLNFLPNDPKTIELAKENDMFLSLLLGNDDSNVFQYYLQVLISILKITDDQTVICQYKNIDFYSFLCQIIDAHFNCLYEIISLFDCLFGPDLKDVVEKVFIVVCKVLSSSEIALLNHSLSETKVVASHLFHSILSSFPDIDVLANDPSLFESIVTNATPETWQLIRNGLYDLNNIIPLFDKLIDHIGQLKNSSTSMQHNSNYFAELFTAYVPRVSNECNVAKILNMCIDLLSSPTVFEQSNDDDQSIISLCEMTSSILDSNKDIQFDNLSNVISKTLPMALQTDNEKKQNAIYNLCLSLATHISDGNDQINQIMKSLYSIETDRWNYRPNNFRKSSTGFLGLTNLGATCYMNSVLQQLFFFKPFRDSVFIEKVDSKSEGGEAFIEFQKIFAQLLISKKSFADTRPFCNTWKGWGKAVINVREQQDAVEFLNMFLDQLPESLKESYKGTLINQIEGISEDFKTNNIETFFAFSLEIKNFTTIDESFDNFLQDELFTGENQIKADTLDRKIDARKYSRIQTAPPVLILHLKRFEYDIRTYNRNKIYSRFVIPQEINIQKLLVNNEEMLYELKGVVLHFGNANGGHYTSLIKINGKFYNFNDMNVSLFDENDFEKETFGGNQMNGCAYLLFYERKNKDEIDSNYEVDKEKETLLIPPEMRSEIVKENDEFVICQSAFTMPTMHFASYCNEIQLMTDYYINIFLHSGLGEESHVIVERLKNCMASNSQEKWFVRHLIQIFAPKITDFFTNCSNEDIMSSFIDIFRTIIFNSDIKLQISSQSEDNPGLKRGKEEENENENDHSEEHNENENENINNKERNENENIINEKHNENDNINNEEHNENDNINNEEHNEGKLECVNDVVHDKEVSDKSDADKNGEISIFIDNSELLFLLFEFSDLIIKYSPSIGQWRQYKWLFQIPYILIKRCNLDIIQSGSYQRINSEHLSGSVIKVYDRSDPSREIQNSIDISPWLGIITDAILSFYKNSSSEVVLENVNFSDAFKILSRGSPVGVESPLMDYYSKIILSKSNIPGFFSFSLKTKQAKFDIESGFTYFYCDQFNLSDNKNFIQYAKNVLSLTDFNCKFYLLDKDHISITNDVISMFIKQIRDKKNIGLRDNLIRNYVNYVYPYLTSDANIFTRDRAAGLTIDLFPNLPPIDEIRPVFRSQEKEKVSITEKQVEELNSIWNQLNGQLNELLNLNDPAVFFSNYQENKTDYEQNDFIIFQFLSVMKWIQVQIHSKERQDFERFMLLLKKLNEFNIEKNTNLSVIADILISYPVDFWIDDAFTIFKASLINFVSVHSNAHFQDILDQLDSLPIEKVDEIFNDDECLNKLIDFFKTQNCISYYDTFKFLNTYLVRNPQKIDRFFFIFDVDKFDPDDSYENMKCILNIPNSTIPNDILYRLLKGIIMYLSRDNIHYYDIQNSLKVFSSLKNKFSSLDQLSSQFDFSFIDAKIINNLILVMDSASYQSQDLTNLIELLCINQRVREIYYDIIHQNLYQSNEYRYSFTFLLTFYSRIVDKYAVGQELIEEVKFLSNELKESATKKPRNNFFFNIIYALIIRANDMAIFKDLLYTLMISLNIFQKYDSPLEEFVIKMIRSLGIDEMKSIVSQICEIEDEEKKGFDNKYISNLALVIEIFPEILQFMKEKYPSSIPSTVIIFNFRVQNAFYPKE